MKGWYGFDLDGTLAFYTGRQGPQHIGEPVKLMLDKLKWHLAQGDECRIMTARAYPLGVVLPENDLAGYLLTLGNGAQQAVDSVLAIREWCKEHVGQVLTVTCVKDYGMIELFDDRACQVIPNTGVLLESLVSQLQAELEKLRAAPTT